jgi:TetR/AcrR family transcriptional repressor of nem operon
MQADTKTRILELASNLLQDKGYNAFSYQHISSELGIKNAAVHYHYPTKESLGLDIIRRKRENFAALQQRALEENLNPGQQFELFLNIYRDNLTNNQQVCLLGSLGTDYFTLPNSMQLEAQRMVNEITDWLSNLLAMGLANGFFAFKGECRSKAITIATSMAGALQMARVVGNEHFYDIVEQIKTDIAP